MSSAPCDQNSLAAAAFNMRYVSLSQFRNVRQASQRTQIAIQKAIIGSITNPAKSLDLLRQTLQPDINRELDEVLRKYVSRFFKPGLRNIRDNERLSNARASANAELIASLNEVILARICKQMLEEAAKRYIVQDVNEPLDDASDADSETRSEASGMSKRRRVDPSYFDGPNSHGQYYAAASGTQFYGTPTQGLHPFQVLNANRRRRAYDAESVAASECTSQKSGSQKSVTSRARIGANKFYTISPLAVAHEPVRPASANPSHYVTDRNLHAESLVRPASANPATHSHTAHRHRHTNAHVAHEAQLMRTEPARLDESSLFVLGSHANKALGLGAIRGKIYAKHNWLFKYVCDSEDKQWLANEASMLHSSGGKAILLLRSDVTRLAETSEYRNVRIDLSKLRSFKVPSWMIQKMMRCASNVPDSATASSADWTSQRGSAEWGSGTQPDGGWSAPPSAGQPYPDNWPSGAQGRHHPETWSATHSGHETPVDSRNAAESDDEAVRGGHAQREREPLPFARLVTDPAAKNGSAQDFNPACVAYAHTQSHLHPHAFVVHDGVFSSEQHAHVAYDSHELVATAASPASALELSGAFDLVDGEVLGHGVAVEEVVTSNENEHETHVEDETHGADHYYS